jgi:small subunit ribosomal protein S16
MVRIRLRRAGGKGQPTHRIVAADKESPRDGRFIEILGDYNPRTEPSTIRIKEDRVYHWLSVGAKPSKPVMQIFHTVGLMERYQRFQNGEGLDVLIAEATKLAKERYVDPRTRRDDLVKVSKPKKAAKPAAEETVDTVEPEVKVEEMAGEPAAKAPVAAVEPEPEAEAPVAEVEPEPEAEVLVAEVEPEPEAEAPVAEAAPEPEELVEEPAAVVEPEPEPAATAVEEVKITDAARELAEEKGIDLSTVKGTGKDGNILKSDIEKLIKD